MSDARIVIVGGGFGGLFTTLGLGGVGHATLISQEDHFLFTPLLYEYLSGEVEAWHIAPRYKELLEADVRFVQGRVTGVDLSAQEVAVEGRARRIAYDVLVLATGGVTNYAGVEGAAEHALPFRKLADADRLRMLMIDVLDRVPPDAAPQDVRRATTFIVVGAGASGVELSTKMADLLRDAFRRRGLQGAPRVIVVEMSDRVVPTMDDEIRRHVEEALRSSGVEVHTQTTVRRVAPGRVVVEHKGQQQEIEVAAAIWTGGVRPNPLVESLDVEKNRNGLIVVEPTLQVRHHANVFALGDIALCTAVDSPRLIGTAQLAYQQAGLVAANVRALIERRPLETRRFHELGEAVSLGTERAAVLTSGLVVDGALGRQARFALYTSRLPTWHHRLKVGASWFFEGTAPRPLSLERY